MSALLSPSPTTQIIDTDPERVGLWMQARSAGFYRPGVTYIGLERHGELVAATRYDLSNGACMTADIAIDGQITREWLWFIFHYPFVQVGVNVIIGLIAEDNRKSRRLVEHLGFSLLTAIPDADPTGDMLLYVMPKAQCRWLRRPHGEVR